MIGDRIRQLRESKGILLRKLAAQLDIDTALLSKMERGERQFKKEDIKLLALIFEQPEEELLSAWLAYKVYDLVKDEELAYKALNIARKDLKITKTVK